MTSYAKRLPAMSVSGARRAKELNEKYTKIVYGIREEQVARPVTRSMFCPSCGSYVPPQSKCPKCGFQSEGYRAANERNTDNRKTE